MINPMRFKGFKAISPERELNPRHLVYKTSALPLSYQGIISHYFVLDYHD